MYIHVFMYDDAELFETTRCACLASRRAMRRITRRFDQALRKHGLRATQFTLLAALRLMGPRNIAALADVLDAERSTISRNLAVAEQQGLLRLAPDPGDARSRIAHLTDRGRATLERAFPTWREVQRGLAGEMGVEALHGLHRLAGGPCVAPFPKASTTPEESRA